MPRRIDELKKIPTIEDCFRVKNLQAVIFDMDGTLIHSEPLHASAGFKAIEQIGGKIPPREKLMDFVNEFKGKADPIVFDELKDRGIVPRDGNLDKFLNLKNELLGKMALEIQLQDVLKPALLTLISQLQENKIKLALVTASERRVVEDFINAWDLTKYFDLVLTRNDTLKTKPDPMPYLEAMKLLKVVSETTLIFEDSLTGLQAASASGAWYYQASWYD